jgi:bloom syndrome protein
MIAVFEDGLTVVFSPLCSLIEDQLSRLNSLNINAEWFSSTLTETQQNEIFYNLSRRNLPYKILFCTPEKLIASTRLREALNQLYTRGVLKRFVLDEIHCFRGV